MSTAEVVVTLSVIVVLAGGALTAILLQRRNNRRWAPHLAKRPGQDAALAICADVYGMPELKKATISWRFDLNDQGEFSSGWSVGYVREFFKFGIVHVRERGLATPIEHLQELAHCLAHLYCKKHKIGPEPPVFGWNMDLAHGARVVWGQGGLVERAQQRIAAEVVVP